MPFPERPGMRLGDTAAMNRAPRKEVFRTREYEVHILGAPAPGLGDLYHAMLRLPWWAAAGVVTAAYLALNAGFAGLYLLTGGLSNAQEGSFADAFFFSVQTMGTIGYGAIAPVSRAANALVVVESVVGLAFTALATGLVFVRFSLQRARLMFSRHAVIGALDGRPALMLRIGNERRGRIVDARFRFSFTRTTTSSEGVTMYRSVDLPLLRDHATALSRSWNVVCPILEGSPLEGVTPESLAAMEAEFVLLVTGIDDTTLQPVHAMNTWMASDVLFGHRLADVIRERPDGNMELDLAKFHAVVPVEKAA